jgi:hypothetical protein
MRHRLLFAVLLLLTPSLAHASDMTGLLFIFTAIIPAVIVLVLLLALLLLTRAVAAGGEKNFRHKLCPVLAGAIYVISGLGIITTLLLMPGQLSGAHSDFALGMLVPLGLLVFGIFAARGAAVTVREPGKNALFRGKTLLASFGTVVLLVLLGGYLWENLPY